MPDFPSPIVFMFVQHGCPACDQAAPEFERWKSKRPLVMALTVDADGPYAEHFFGRAIRATPVYLVRVGDESVKHEGMLKAEGLEKWVNGVLKEWTT